MEEHTEIRLNALLTFSEGKNNVPTVVRNHNRLSHQKMKFDNWAKTLEFRKNSKTQCFSETTM